MLYIAHIIMLVRYKDGDQGDYPVWENCILIDADSDEAAWRAADAIGYAAEGDSDGSFMWNERPATWEFKGTRRLVSCNVATAVSQNAGEVTYLQLLFSNKSEFDKYCSGKPAYLLLEE